MFMRQISLLAIPLVAAKAVARPPGRREDSLAIQEPPVLG